MNSSKNAVQIENGVLALTAASGKFHDSISQGKRIVPGNKTYVFTVETDASVAKKAYLQIKFYKGKKELKRISSSTAPAGKSVLSVFGSHPEADLIEVAMRVYSGAENKVFKFSKPVLIEGKKGELYGNWLAVGKGFTVTDKKANSFTVNVTAESPMHAAVLLQVPVFPNKKMVFSADVNGTADIGYLEVKLLNGPKMIARKNNIGTSDNSVLEFDTGDTNIAILHCRVPATARNIGKSVTFSNFKFDEAE